MYNKGIDQPTWMHRLVCAIVFHIQQNWANMFYWSNPQPRFFDLNTVNVLFQPCACDPNLSMILLLGTVPVNWIISTTCIYFIFQPCDCDPHGSFDNNCDPLTGQCACKLDFNGTQCDSCLYGFYGFPDCHLCLCSVEGTNPRSCDSDGACRCANADGQCNCKVSRSIYSLLPHSAN